MLDVLMGAALGLTAVSIGLRAEAHPAAIVRYVSAVTGVDTGNCATASAPCQSIQYALDQAADGDEVRIAAFDNVAPTIYTSTANSVISLTKNLTLRGGYLYQHVISHTWTPG